jgi:hypothetical protein
MVKPILVEQCRNWTTAEEMEFGRLEARRLEILKEIQVGIESEKLNPNFKSLCREGKSIQRTMSALLRIRGLRMEKSDRVFYFSLY